MSTTTLDAIRANTIAIIEALTPTTLTDVLFRRADRSADIREVSTTDGALRTFEVRRTGGVQKVMGVLASDQDYRTEELSIIVAYPVEVGLYGLDDLDDLDDIARADARQIHDAVYSAANYLSGQNAAYPAIQALDRSRPDVWFQELIVQVEYFEAQSYS